MAGRNYVEKSSKEWFEIWVAHQPKSWARKKIVFRDISEKPTFWLADCGSIVNGDCYWMEFSDDLNEDYIWLSLGVANSEFITQYYDWKFNNKLYAGRRRFMSQYVEQFPLPNINDEISKKIIETTKKAYYDNENQISQYLSVINQLVRDVFNQKKN